MEPAIHATVVRCPECGTLSRAILSYGHNPPDNDWDDGTCTSCGKPIISERCRSISMTPVRDGDNAPRPASVRAIAADESLRGK